MDFPGYCDFCLEMLPHITSKPYYCKLLPVVDPTLQTVISLTLMPTLTEVCKSDHPETGFSVAICSNCWEEGRSCPSKHQMYVTTGVSTKCPRIVPGPSSGLRCDVCETGIREGAYFRKCLAHFPQLLLMLFFILRARLLRLRRGLRPVPKLCPSGYGLRGILPVGAHYEDDVHTLNRHCLHGVTSNFKGHQRETHADQQ